MTPPAIKKPAPAKTPAARKPDLAEVIGDIAERVLGNNRRTRDVVVPAVLERLVLHVLETDERFVGTARGLFWEMAAQREANELARRRVEERNAEAAAAGELETMVRMRRLAQEQGLPPPGEHGGGQRAAVEPYEAA